MRNKNADYSAALLLCIAFIVLVSTGGAAFYVVAGSNTLVSGVENDRVITTLFVFEADGKPLSSYIVFYYPATTRAAIFDVPGDIGRILKRVNRVDRIDTVYDGQHPDSYIDEIEGLLAVDINYSVIIDLPSLGKFVDLLDGVPVSIPQQIEIYDESSPVLFPSGKTVLDGDKARIYIAWEDTDSDIEAASNRRERFFIGFIKKLSEKNEYLKKQEVDRLTSRLMRTNMNHRTKQELFNRLAKIDTDRITVQTVGGNYREISGQRLLFPFYDASLVKDIVLQTAASLTREGALSSSGRVITVEVLNGTNVSGLASRTAELIRVFGYDVIKIGNAQHSDYTKTEVVDHINQFEEAKSFADIIKCENITTDTDSPVHEDDMQSYEYRADFTLILGKDFNGRWTQGS